MGMHTLDAQRRAFYEIAEAIAPTWERRRADVEKVATPVREWMLRELRPSEGDTVLELAAGVGETGFAAAAILGPSGRLLAVQSCGDDPALEMVHEVWPDEQPFKVNRHELIKVLRDELGREAKDFNFVSGSDAKSIFRYEMHTLPSEVSQSIGTSTLFAAWNAASYVAQIEDERIESAMRDGDQYLQGTAKVLKKHKGLWFNDESFVVSRKQ